MRKLLLISTGILILLGACKNDLELNANWKDITIVYGLFNQKESVQYIKINKAFLGEGNVFPMAQNPDSSTYDNDLDVQVEEWKNGKYNNKTLVFDTCTIYNKDTGTFYCPWQIIYKSNQKLDSSSNDIEYRLKITNNKTGKVISSHTKLIKKFIINHPSRVVPNPTVNLATKTPAIVNFTTVENGNAMYFKAVYRFHYFEQNFVTQEAAIHSVDFIVGEAIKSDINQEIELSFPCKDFFSTLQSKIPANPNVIRKVIIGNEMELIIYASDFNYYTYMQFVKNANGMNQGMIEYTNIENGIGIFASRYFLNACYDLSTASLDSLYYGSYTKDLGFQR